MPHELSSYDTRSCEHFSLTEATSTAETDINVYNTTFTHRVRISHRSMDKLMPRGLGIWGFGEQ